MMTCLKGKGGAKWMLEREILAQEKQEIHKKQASSKTSCMK